MKSIWIRVKDFLQGLSFRTGVLTLVACAVFYIISFGVFLLPLATSIQGILWTIFFGLAKATQYAALLILGNEGVVRLKRALRREKR
jgi:phosphoglycolate phosphatase